MILKTAPLFVLLFIAQQPRDLEQIKHELNQALVQFNSSTAAKLIKEAASEKNEKSMDVLVSCLYYLWEKYIPQAYSQKESVIKDISTATFSIERAKQDLNDPKWDQEEKDYIKGEIARIEKTLSDRQTQLKELTEGLKEVRETLHGEVIKYTDEKAIASIIKKFKGEKNSYYKGLFAHVLVKISHRDIMPVLLEALKPGQEPGVAVAIIEAFKEAGEKSEEAMKAVREAIKSGYWQVKLAAKNYFEPLEKKDAIEPLIEMLKDTDGRVQLEILKTLWKVTGENIGEHTAWKAWYNKNKEALRDGTFKRNERPETDFPINLSGMPFYSKSVIILLDCSHSMRHELQGYKNDPELEKKLKIELKGNRRIDAARLEVKKIMKQLPKGTKFNVILFNNSYSLYSQTAQSVDEHSLINAFNYIDQVNPQGGTDIYTALIAALKAGLDNNSRPKKDGADTIYIITDGITENGLVKDTTEIAGFVTDFNKLLQSSMHTILINDKGRGSFTNSSKFLQLVASSNNGFYHEASGDASLNVKNDADYEPSLHHDYATSFPENPGDPTVYRPPKIDVPPLDIPNTFFGVPVRGKSIIFVIDKTGSMSKKMINYIPDIETSKKFGLVLKDTSKLEIAKFELKKILINLAAGTMFNIIYFDTKVTPFSHVMVRLDQNSLGNAIRFIDSATPSGKTDIHQGLMTALKCTLDPNGQPQKGLVDSIYLLSDGEPTSGLKDINEIARQVSEVNKWALVSINGVLINEPYSASAVSLFKMLTRANNGLFAEVLDKPAPMR